MKCPKCHYLSFEPESRCRNCGYDFAFAQEDLMMKTGDEPEGPMKDIPLRPTASESAKATPITLGPIRPVSPAPRVSAAAAAGAAAAAVAERLAVSEPPRREIPRRPPAPRPVMPSAPQVPAPVVRRPPPAIPTVPASAAPAAPAAPAATVAPPVAIAAPPVAAAPPAPVQSAPVVEAPPAPKPAPVASVPAVPRIVAAPPAPAAPKAPISVELPLFVKGTPKTEDRSTPEGEPVVAVPAAPPPLSVRRRTPDPARVQATYQREVPVARKAGPVDRDLLEDLQRLDQSPATQRAPHAEAAEAESTADVMPATRATAAGVDVLMLGGINVAIVWLTLRWCELSLGSIGVLPLFPLAAFLLLIDAGYLLLFTAANGQTVGKMVTGIRVVDIDDAGTQHRVTTGQAALRAICSVGSVFALGAGFIPALMGSGRAFHDRIAHTRVVRV